MIEKYIQYRITVMHIACSVLLIILIITFLSFVIWKFYKWMMKHNEKRLQKMIDEWEKENVEE